MEMNRLPRWSFSASLVFSTFLITTFPVRGQDVGGDMGRAAHVNAVASSIGQVFNSNSPDFLR